MSYLRTGTATIVTGTDGAGTGYTPSLNGFVHSIRYAKTDFADGVDFDVTVESTGEVLWDQDNVNAAAIKYPRIGVHNSLGTAITFDGTAAVPIVDRVALVDDRVKVVVANGGTTGQTGSFIVQVT